MCYNFRSYLYEKIKAISNLNRFKIIEIAEREPISIARLSAKLNLSYTKCSNYVTLLEKAGLIQKKRVGKETHIRSRVKLGNNLMEVSCNLS